VAHSIREARLRPEFAELYPSVEPDAWLPATVIGQRLLLWHLTRSELPEGERLMDERHFEFRGGEQRDGGSAVRTRRGEG
jgi:hypothetical protein